MTYKIVYQEKALLEYEQATLWYRERSEQAAAGFRDAVQEKIGELYVRPGQYKRSYKNFHEVALKKYPYSLIYLVREKEQTVIIFSIYHHKRSPQKKYRK